MGIALLGMIMASTEAVVLKSADSDPEAVVKAEKKKAAEEKAFYEEMHAKAMIEHEKQRIAAKAAEEDYQRRSLPDGHVHTMGGEDIDPITGKSIHLTGTF